VTAVDGVCCSFEMFEYFVFAINYATFCVKHISLLRFKSRSYDASVCVVEKMRHEAAATSVKKIKPESSAEQLQPTTQTKSKQKSSDSVAVSRDSVDAGTKPPSVQVTYTAHISLWPPVSDVTAVTKPILETR